jgi:hypothetical protein
MKNFHLADMAIIEQQICTRATSKMPERVLRSDIIPYKRLDKRVWAHDSDRVSWWSAWISKFFQQPHERRERQINATARTIEQTRA